jgi:acyl carrier protein
METSMLEERVRAVIARTFRLSEETVAGELRMGNPPAWDSLGHMGLVAAFEQEFDVRFPVHALPELVSVPAILDALSTQFVIK